MSAFQSFSFSGFLIEIASSVSSGIFMWSRAWKMYRGAAPCVNLRDRFLTVGSGFKKIGMLGPCKTQKCRNGSFFSGLKA